MDTKKVYEFWLVTPNGEKLNKFVSVLTDKKELSDEEVKEKIAKKFELDIDKCTDIKIKFFG